jgi:MEMO1 family protein
MDPIDRPRLRPVEAFPVHEEGNTFVVLRDPQQYAPPLMIAPAAYFILSHFDGRHSLLDIQEAYCRRFGQILFSEDLKQIVDLLDDHGYLYGGSFGEKQAKIAEEFRLQPVRVAAHAGTVYRAEPNELKLQLKRYFQEPDGPGQPNGVSESPTPRAIVAPHIDFHRGGPAYAWAYKPLAECPGADLYVLLGTSHCGGDHPFTATLKDFATPLGAVETDKEFVQELQERSAGDLFAEEPLHRTEHSLEFQVVYLRYVAELRAEWAAEAKPFKIVPLLVSSFHQMVRNRTLPESDPRTGSILTVLRELIARERRRVCIVAGVDFAHVGMQFGDSEPLTAEFLRWVEDEDRLLIEKLSQVDAAGFFHEIAKDQDRRRICGFSPLYSLIHLLDGSRGRCLKYSQAFTKETGSAVTFASLIFD